MYVDALAIAAIADELKTNVLDGRVQDVVASGALELGLEVYANHRRRYLVMSADPKLARIHLADDKLRRGLDAPTPLLLLLRKWIRGARLAQIETPAFERIVRLVFDHPDLGTSALIVEVMGRHSNIILVDAGGMILDSVKRVGSDINRYRVLLPHASYVPPPPQEKLPLDQATELRLRNLLDAGAPADALWKTLVQGLRGMSPLLAREAAHRAYGDAAILCGDIERITPLLDALRGLIAPLHGAGWEPSVGLEDVDDAGEVVCFAPYALTHYRRWRPVASISEAVVLWLGAGSPASDAYRAARVGIERLLDEAIERVRRRIEQLRQQLASYEDLESLRQAGELILAYGWGAPAGQKELVVPAEEGQPPRKIAIDPALSPAENAQAYFQRYQKAKRSRDEIPPLLQSAGLELEKLEQWKLDLLLAANRPEIDDVRAELIEAGYLKGRVKKRKPLPSAGPLTLAAPGGLTILVGRNSRQNDHLTFKIAQADDLWFHARGVAGAHVILRLAGREASEEAIRRAAEAAAYYSSARQDTTVKVDCTVRRYVKRRPGGAAGQVTYRQERTLTVQPQP